MKNLSAILLMMFSLLVNAQVGINTNNPNEYTFLDVRSSNKGILIPRVNLNSIFDIQTVTSRNASANNRYENGTLVYNMRTSEIIGENSKNNVKPGFYFWQTDRWVRLADKREQNFFYMPSIVIPTAADQVPSGQFGRINLYEYYKAQFSTSYVRNANATTTLPIYVPSDLDYYITWYDNTVFTNVSVNSLGILTYEVLPNAEVTIGSFMNIIFAVR